MHGSIDGWRSFRRMQAAAVGKKITTIEGLARGNSASGAEWRLCRQRPCSAGTAR